MIGRMAPSRRAVVVALSALVATTLSCGPEKAPPPPTSSEQAALGGELAAKVGTDVIGVTLVAKVAAAQHITPREALRLLVDDAICANAARARGLDHQEPTTWLLTAARGRFSADRFLAEARRAGPPTDAEIGELTKRYWREVDRPPMLRVVHALAHHSDPKKPDPELDKRARAIADDLHAAVLTARDEDDFQTKAKAVPHGDVQVTVEAFGPFAADEEGVDKAFRSAAFTLGEVGDTTPVFESSFGWHVVRLVERLPEQRMSLEERRIAFTDEAYLQRAHDATAERLKALRASSQVAISPSAETLMRSLHDTADRRPTP